MLPLDWNKFDALPGCRSQNFENLCRALIRIKFGGFGQFRALRNQPGVEFDLKLTHKCSSLGQPTRWYGWQCKFHTLTNAGLLRSASKSAIEESLLKTKQHFPDVTDWVLWTPYTLKKQDQKWFSDLSTTLTLHLWSKEEIETYLSGQALTLRHTYFGDLIATPQELKQRHIESVQPIREKWLEPIHQTTEAEKTIRKMLGEPGSWSHLKEVGKHIKDVATKTSYYSEHEKNFPKETVDQFVEVCRTFSSILLDFHDVLADGDLDIIQQQLHERQTLIDDNIKSVPRQLRKLNVPIAIDATNGLHYLRVAQRLLDEVDELLGVGIVALLADAGGGKTQIAAAITSYYQHRSAGVLLHGRDLRRGSDLNELARKFSLNEKPLESFQQLLATLDAAAKRNQCRLPLVIDGLNEAENPKDWKAPLATLVEEVKLYPNVLVVCTLRTGERSRKNSIQKPDTQPSTSESFAVMALPEHIRRIKSDGFGSDADEAIQRYFHYFKIETGDTEIPIEFFRHPLTLRIFCQSTNPDRNSVRKINFFPASLTLIFTNLVENAAHRISDLPNLSHSYQHEEIHAAIYHFGIMLWEGGTRKIREICFRDVASDSNRHWESSIVNLLTQEGLIFRDPGEKPHEYVISAAYDALGGFFIANSLLKKFATDNSFDWLNDSNTIKLFSGEGSHKLAADIFHALVSLVPQRFPMKQLWMVAPSEFRNAALIFSIRLNADSLDNKTVDALRKLFNEKPKERSRFFHRLYTTRATVDHPLNADFLDEMLRPIVNVAERDLSWTEWIRTTRGERYSDILAVEESWKASTVTRSESDRLRARWIMWHLTTTDHKLREVATRALYWFGRGNPSMLFRETISSLDISDPYIPERMFAASYGVAMALHSGLSDSSFSSCILPKFARKVFDTMFIDGARYKTTHILLREYALRTIEIAVVHNPSLFSHEELVRTKPPFPDSDISSWGEASNSGEKEESTAARSPFRMDFADYTIGQLVPDRMNYNYEHEGYKKAKARILWRIEQLGWSADDFGEIDQRIPQDQGRSIYGYSPRRTDRYGKKYSWIAYFELSGLLHDLGAIDHSYDQERSAYVDIDPSFPKRIRTASLIDIDILGDHGRETDDWIARGENPNITPYLRIPQIQSHEGPWIALDGFTVQEDQARGRNSFFFLRSFIVKNAIATDLFHHLSRQNLGGRWLPNKPSVTYAFAGEIPWCETYPPNGTRNLSFVVNEKEVTVMKTRVEIYVDGEKIDVSPSDIIKYRLLGNDALGGDDNQLSGIDIDKIEYRNASYEAKEIKQEFAKFEVFIPVCDFNWNGHQTAASDAIHATTLAKEIADDLDLIVHAQEFDLFTKDGARASLGVSDHSGDFNNTQSIFFMREDLLQSYLQKNDSVLIWAIWGERGYSTKIANAISHGTTRSGQTHGDIREIIRYETVNHGKHKDVQVEAE